MSFGSSEGVHRSRTDTGVRRMCTDRIGVCVRFKQLSVKPLLPTRGTSFETCDDQKPNHTTGDHGDNNKNRSNSRFIFPKA